MRWNVKNVFVKFLMSFIILLSTSWSSAQTIDSLKADHLETLLSKGNKAPFDGVLVPYKQYYLYNDAIEQKYEIDHDDTEEPKWSPLAIAATFLAVGFTTGFLIDCP